MSELDEDRVAAWWHANSAAQGLPDEIDPAIIQRIADLALTGLRRPREPWTGPNDAPADDEPT